MESLYENQAQRLLELTGLLDCDQALINRVADYLTQHTLRLLHSDGEARLAQIMLGLRGKDSGCAHTKKDGCFDIEVSQGRLAYHAGLSRSYASTLINEWKRRGILVSIGRTLCVRSPSALARIADGTYCKA
jgi:CRP-like cAMP-binding protein